MSHHVETYHVMIEYETTDPVDAKAMRHALSNATHKALMSWHLGHSEGPYGATVTITTDSEPLLDTRPSDGSSWSVTKRSTNLRWQRSWQMAKDAVGRLTHHGSMPERR